MTRTRLLVVLGTLLLAGAATAAALLRAPDIEMPTRLWARRDPRPGHVRWTVSVKPDGPAWNPDVPAGTIALCGVTGWSRGLDPDRDPPDVLGVNLPWSPVSFDTALARLTRRADVRRAERFERSGHAVGEGAGQSFEFARMDGAGVVFAEPDLETYFPDAVPGAVAAPPPDAGALAGAWTLVRGNAAAEPFTLSRDGGAAGAGLRSWTAWEGHLHLRGVTGETFALDAGRGTFEGRGADGRPVRGRRSD